MTVAALGDDEQRKELFQSRKKAELGCFAFTEVGAGVMTGIGVETTGNKKLLIERVMSNIFDH